MTVALYPGAFDPITNGHLDIATRAAKLFEKVIIGVYDTPAKNLLFNTTERMNLVRRAIAGIPNIEVQPFYGLTVDFARKAGAQVIVRGLRAGADFEREFEMALMNKKLAPDCELVCLMANLKYQFLSSSLLKEVASLNGDINDLVPKEVAIALRKKMRIKARD
ncbi:MAG: pantetheine-phosphate adenylyltransferase [Chloroflexota bacterium]